MPRFIQNNQEIGWTVEKSGNCGCGGGNPAEHNKNAVVGRCARALAGVALVLTLVLNVNLQAPSVHILSQADMQAIVNTGQQQQFRADIIEDIIDIIEDLINPKDDDDDDTEPSTNP